MTGVSTIELIPPRDTDRVCTKGKTFVAECSACGRVVMGRNLHFPFIAHGFYCAGCCPCRSFIPTVADKEAMKEAKTEATMETRRFVVIAPPVVDKARLEADRSAAKARREARKEERLRAKEDAVTERLRMKEERLTRGLTVKAAREKLAVERAERQTHRVARAYSRNQQRAEWQSRVSYREADLLSLDERYLIDKPDFSHLEGDAARIERNRFIKKRRLLETKLSPEEKLELKRQRLTAAAKARVGRRQS